MGIIRFFVSVIVGAILGAAAGAAILAQHALRNAPAGGNWFGSRADHVRFAIATGIFYGAMLGAFIGLIVRWLGLGKLGGAAVGAGVGLVLTVAMLAIGASSAETLWGILSIPGLSLVGLAVAFLNNVLRKPDLFS
jgi:hypothetical protein